MEAKEHTFWHVHGKILTIETDKNICRTASLIYLMAGSYVGYSFLWAVFFAFASV
jgi:hypothetical protein